jgi:hemolysin activation/secretion protein
MLAVAPLSAARAQFGTGQIAPPASPIERALPEAQPRPLPPLLPGAETPGPEVDEGPTALVRDVEIDGASVYAEAELHRLLADIEGKTFTQGRIAAAVGRIQTRYRQDGYFLTVVRGTLTPDGDAVTLHLRIIEGWISQIKIDGDIGPAGVLVYNFLSNLTAIRPANIADVERYLLLANDIPGVSVRTVLRPAAGEAGGAELVAQVARSAFTGYYSFDNRGANAAGPEQLVLSGSANSFTNFGERSSLLLFNTPFNKEQRFGESAFEGFVGSDGLKLRGYLGYGISKPGDAFAATGYKSRLFLAGTSATYPLIRTRPLSLNVTAAFDLSHAEIDIFGATPPIRERQSNSHLRVVRLATTLEVQDQLLGGDRLAANSFSFGVHEGIVGLGSGHNNESLQARDGNVIDFTKWTGDATRVQNLAEFDDHLLALKLVAGGQWTRDILPPSEEYFVGGPRFVRGFFAGELTGDRAFGGTIEFQLGTGYDFSVFGERLAPRLQYYVFYDGAAAWNRSPGDLRRHLESAGAGIRLDIVPEFSVELEFVRRYTLRPAADDVQPEGKHVIFARVSGRF